jgi:Cof subfamily protein (haloacid dehalogenase superfamily)
MVFDLQGKLIYERTLDEETLALACTVSRRLKCAFVCYSGERIYCEDPQNKHVVDMRKYNDHPEPFEQGLHLLPSKGLAVHKVIILAEKEEIDKVRPTIEATLEGVATVTQAVETMLEVLPLGASKGDGVKRLLDHIGISPEDTIAFGDGENDVEMFQNVFCGIAVSNAKSMLKQHADAFIGANTEEGVATALQEILTEVDHDS